jgi:redox-sensitive bicupin YhaK (pirin superfamily)
MAMYRVYAGPDGESHIEELSAERQADLTAFTNITQAGINHHSEMRNMDFHPLPERRLIIHLAGEVEIGMSDGSKQIFRPGDVRLMEDVTGRGHTHRDLSPSTAFLARLED